MELLWETNTANYDKCGEILTSFYTDKRLYALKCLFCTDSCNNLADFIEHIEVTHSSMLTTKTEVDNIDPINSVFVEPKEEDLDENIEPAVHPFKKSDSEEKQEGNVSVTTESSVKLETDNESDDNDFKEASESEGSSGSDTDEDVKMPRNSFLDTEIDANPDLSLALIEGWEKLPILWNKKITQSNARKKREDALRKLSKELNKKFGKRLKWTGMQERIKNFRVRYRHELMKEQRAKSKGKDHKPIWYFPKLHFLKDTVQLTQSNLEDVDEAEKLFEEIPFADEQDIQFIGIYKSFPCLWDIEHTSFKSKNEREKALKDILKQVNEKMELKLTEDDIQRKLHRIRKTCTKEKLEQLKCEGLGITYQPNFKYYSSIDFLLENVYPFKCPYCKETFKGREPFRVHKSKHDGSSPFTCSICKKVYSSSGHLAIHLRRHNRDYVVECKPCGRKFLTTDEYKIHMRHHTGEKPYFCDLCGKSFATGNLFGRHKRRHENRPSHFCTICSRGFYEQIRYKEHMKIHNNVRDRVCDVCGKGFTHLKYLKQHVLIHSGRKDYICKICGKKFAQSAGLYLHMKTHGSKLSEKISTDNKQIKEGTAKKNG